MSSYDTYLLSINLHPALRPALYQCRVASRQIAGGDPLPQSIYSLSLSRRRRRGLQRILNRCEICLLRPTLRPLSPPLKPRRRRRRRRMYAHCACPDAKYRIAARGQHREHVALSALPPRRARAAVSVCSSTSANLPCHRRYSLHVAAGRSTSHRRRVVHANSEDFPTIQSSFTVCRADVVISLSILIDSIAISFILCSNSAGARLLNNSTNPVLHVGYIRLGGNSL